MADDGLGLRLITVWFGEAENIGDRELVAGWAE